MEEEGNTSTLCMAQGNTLASIECRHRKEKKELQAQIQGLKKAAKNDKTKKKELSIEIARLEVELENRHKQELSALEIETEDLVEDVQNDVAKLKISKAQRRRDKKSQQEREREEEIKQQAKDNLHGPRNIEMQSIGERLKKKNLKIFSIPSDGDCLYKAVAHQLLLKHQKSLTIEELRRNVAEHIRLHKEDFIPFMSNPETYEMLTDEDFFEYCDKIINTKVWGGQLEIRALSNSLKCPINVIQASGPDCIEQGAEFEGSPLIITYHRHMYRLGEHYNSTCLNEDTHTNE